MLYTPDDFIQAPKIHPELAAVENKATKQDVSYSAWHLADLLSIFE